MALNRYAVFSSYLDQGIMSAAVAALFWHLKALTPNKTLFYAATTIALLALVNVFFVFEGRTGQLVGVAMVSSAIFWVLPKRWPMATLLVPPLLFLLAVFSFDKVAQRLISMKTEISQYSAGVGAATSQITALTFGRGL
jgi:O-antigen ligase